MLAQNLTLRLPTRLLLPLPPLLPDGKGRSRLLIRTFCKQAGLRVVYSASKKDVHIDTLAELLETEHCGGAAWTCKVKLGRAVRNSSTLVAAFIRDEDFSKLASAGGVRGRSLPHDTRELTLIGFARASSDSAFAATIHNLIVHPSCRRRGIGRSLLARLTAQLKRGGVTDIGLMAPEASWGFFFKVDFDEDRELSTPMRYGSSAAEPWVY